MPRFAFSLELHFDTASRKVLAKLRPTLSPVSLSPEVLKAKLEDAGFADFSSIQEARDRLFEVEASLREKGQKIYDELLKRLQPDATGSEPHESSQDAEHASEAEGEVPPEQKITAKQVFDLLKIEPLVLAVAEQKDAEIQITASNDELSAYMTIVPPQGGHPADRKMVVKALKSFGIGVPPLEKEIAKAIKQGQCDRVLVAQGRAAKKGRASKFEALVTDQVSSGPSIDSKGNANYQDINQFVVVEPGQGLMRRHPPGGGKPGQDIYGKAIPAESGDLIPFTANLEGAEVAPHDPNLMVATQKGHPVIQERGIAVDPVLQLTNVSLATGNIDYDGSLHVKEDVADGMKIEVTGDVIVDGVVGKATIIAGASVLIQQGLIGGVPSEEDLEAGTFGAEITAVKTVAARFSSKAKIKAGKEIQINEYAIHCDLNAGDRVLIGKKTGKGSLIGGQARAFDLVYAKTLGSTGSAITHIRVGAPADTVDRLRFAARSVRQKLESIGMLEKDLKAIQRRGEQVQLPAQSQKMAEDLDRQIAQLRDEISELHRLEDELKALLIRSKKSSVVGKNKVYQNVIVDILGGSLRTKEDTIGGTFHFDIRRVVFEH